MKFTSKAEFLEATHQQWQQMWDLVADLESSSVSRKTLKQILGHLYFWHRLAIGWIRTGRNGDPDIPAKGFNWQQTRQLNANIDLEIDELEFESVVRRLKRSHSDIIKIVVDLSDRQFLEPGHFRWTGKNAIASYIVPNTFSHYRWACKKIRKLS